MGVRAVSDRQVYVSIVSLYYLGISLTPNDISVLILYYVVQLHSVVSLPRL